MTTIERLGLPQQLSRFNGWLKETEQMIPALNENVQMVWDKVLRKYVKNTTYSLTKTNVTRQGTWMGYNYLSSLIHDHGSNVSDDGYTLSFDRKTFIAPVGPQAGKEFWVGGQTMTFERGFWTRKYFDPFMNIDAEGNPHEGRISMVVFNSTTFSTTPPKTIRQKYNKVFTRSELAAMGITTEMIAECFYQKFALQTPSEDTHLLNVSTDLEPIEDGIYWPNVYFNGRDDNGFTFQNLIPPYATKTPDFIVRLRAYNDSTTADYPEPNYGGMGNFGKCLDLPFENESVKPVRIVWGDHFSVSNDPDEVVLTFDQNGQRAAIGMCIEYKPLDGKKTDTEMFINLKTGERTLSIFAL